MARNAAPIRRRRARARNRAARSPCRPKPAANGRRSGCSSGRARRAGRVSGRARGMDRHPAVAAGRGGRASAGGVGRPRGVVAAVPRRPISRREGAVRPRRSRVSRCGNRRFANGTGPCAGEPGGRDGGAARSTLSIEQRSASGPLRDFRGPARRGKRRVEPAPIRIGGGGWGAAGSDCARRLDQRQLRGARLPGPSRLPGKLVAGRRLCGRVPALAGVRHGIRGRRPRQPRAHRHPLRTSCRRGRHGPVSRRPLRGGSPAGRGGRRLGGGRRIGARPPRPPGGARCIERVARIAACRRRRP